jgi:hypothetical protein
LAELWRNASVAEFMGAWREADVVSKRGWVEMTYRISYEDGWAAIAGGAEGGATRTEYFLNENEALQRARELVDSGVHHGVSVYDSDGNALLGVCLQLKLGASAVDG